MFLTDSDTEVLLELYIKYGSACLKLLNGMFAFVIYDKTKNSLFGGRDRLGKKPLYYYSVNNHFEFASQPKAIVLNNSIEIDPESQLQYFIWTHIPDPNSIFKNIKKLQVSQILIPRYIPRDYIGEPFNGITPLYNTSSSIVLSCYAGININSSIINITDSSGNVSQIEVLELVNLLGKRIFNSKNILNF